MGKARNAHDSNYAASGEARNASSRVASGMLRHLGSGRARSLIVATAFAGLGAAFRPPAAAPPTIVLDVAVRDSMSAVFRRFNEHWNELADLNSLQKMLSAVPMPHEYLGCLQGEVRGDTIVIDAWRPALHMKQLPLAVTGDCDGVARLVGVWHNHPYHADLENRPLKERELSKQDLDTFAAATDRVALMMWDADSLDAAAKQDGRVVHPVEVRLRAAAASR